MHRRILLFVALVSLWFTPSHAQSQDRFEFTRLLAHWAEYNHESYLPFVLEAEPDVVQLGFYGGHFWSLAHTDVYGGYPAHFPVQGLDECGAWFEEKNKALHAKNIKVVGHFNVEFLVGDIDGPKGPTGFFKFYRDLWDEKQLGPKPVADPVTMLERGPNGKPIGQEGYGIGGMHEYWACLRNPDWQKVLQAWVKRGIDRGVDGYIANYFYKHDCHCEHCQAEFRAYLKERHSAQELISKFDIKNVDSHTFGEMAYWHDPKESKPLKREMLRWAQISNKRVFDQVFHEYGRSLKPDLVSAQWNHLGNFSQIAGDERCLLPANLWGKDETYLWYSTGGAACATDIPAGNLGEGTLQARYIRGMFDDKPYTLGKYEHTRIRVTIAELAANGGAPMGFYTRFTEPEARTEIVRYYQFLKRYEEIFRGNRSHAEAVLVYPRIAVAAGNVEPVEQFRQAGKRLLNAHVLFDVCSDEVEQPAGDAATVIRTTEEAEQAAGTVSSRFDAPATVRISASRPAKGDELDIHFVNYNRTEPPKNKDGTPSTGRGIMDEQPIESPEIKCDVLLPKGFKAAIIEAITPESPDPQPISFTQSDRRIQFTQPKFLVYSIARIKLAR
ncbi:MAG TPA: hypothetical protein VFV87_02880 [Pirellulaceae bacterium]|nr:hypothetical protein [Pirellulaceae bacterium]